MLKLLAHSVVVTATARHVCVYSLILSRKELDDTSRLQHLLYLLHRALPILRLIDKEHKSEIEVESRIQGKFGLESLQVHLKNNQATRTTILVELYAHLSFKLLMLSSIGHSNIQSNASIIRPTEFLKKETTGGQELYTTCFPAGRSECRLPFSWWVQHEKLVFKQNASSGTAPGLRAGARCDCCNTSVVDFHRNCANCSYDLCLACCRELREGYQPGVKKSDSALSSFLGEKSSQATSMNGRIDLAQKIFGWQGPNALKNIHKFVDKTCFFSDWRVNDDGSIPCPPKELGGCGNGVLALKRTFKSNWVVKLISNAERLTNSCHFVDDGASEICSLCPDKCSSIGVDQSTFALRRAAFRKNSHDNFLYCPNAIELGDYECAHFQKHWRRGEPVIVRGVLERTTGLSWDPMVMWRALREKKIKKFNDDGYAVKAVDCLDWCEVG
ncbi:lysine-specific demethylase 3 [Dendrobium catenatum]|uniref:Lysine-specific demethylase 3 n=1 Tax=Dendrobium catenatum TaxID=906689 RepID=A0A2I0XIU9_9ASPA|nr:lysine-specific demethylase 3 [Dendrobium catenatum]